MKIIFETNIKYICRLKISRKLYRKKCETLCYVADMTKRSGYLRS